MYMYMYMHLIVFIQCSIVLYYGVRPLKSLSETALKNVHVGTCGYVHVYLWVIIRQSNYEIVFATTQD